MPTALAKPWPSGPVVVSTPGVTPTSGWPGVFECSWRKLRSSLDRQVVAGQMQQRVLQHRAVAVRQHEAVAVRPMRIRGVVAQVPIPQRDRDLRHAHRHARMPGLRGFDRVHRECADRVGKLGVGGAQRPWVRSWLRSAGVEAMMRRADDVARNDAVSRDSVLVQQFKLSLAHGVRALCNNSTFTSRDTSSGPRERSSQHR